MFLVLEFGVGIGHCVGVYRGWIDATVLEGGIAQLIMQLIAQFCIESVADYEYGCDVLVCT